jgi:putative FmdB family regulatory protein|tara:strand:- start:632 stop:895 length:264 start_codon:yes stop_codon:yes gene_type:complete
MPKYDYRCSECETQFELRHSYKFKDARCTECGSDKVNKILSSVSKVVKKTVSNQTSPVGGEVNKAISDGQRELEKTKKGLKGKVYKK